MKIRNILVPAVAIAAVAGGTTAVATALPPGPNGHNDFGLCTAYFAGSETGQEHKRKAPPFAALEAAASDAGQSMEEYCGSKTPGGR